MIRKLLLLCALLVCTSLSAQQRVNQGEPGPSSKPWWVTGSFTCTSGCAGGTPVLMADATANPTIPQSASFQMIFNGATWDRWKGAVFFASAQHIVCDSGCGSPPAVPDNAVFTFGTTSVTTIAYVVDDVATNTVTENNYGAPRMTASRIPYADLSQTGAYPAATGVSTAAKQDTGNTSLASIDTKLTDVATQTTLALIKAKTDNLDVLLSTRTKPADSQHTTIDSPTTFNNQQTNITADYDTGVGTQTMTMFGLAFPASGGAVAAPGDSTNGLKVQVTAVPTTTVTGTVAATQSGPWTDTVTQATAANLNATVVGTGTDNTANSTAKIPALPCRANAAQPTWTEGNMVPCSVNLAGDTRVSLTNGSLTVAQATAANLNATVIGTVTSNQGTANTLANAWAMKITDATNGPAAVKAASTAPAAADPALVTAISPNGSNPCQNPSVTMTSTVVALSGTTSTQIVAISGTTKIHVCSFLFGWGTGTTPTFALRYGTGTACATGTVTIYPATAITAAVPASGSTGLPQNPYFVTPAGQALCYILTGTTPTGTLILNYVQQ